MGEVWLWISAGKWEFVFSREPLLGLYAFTPQIPTDWTQSAEDARIPGLDVEPADLGVDTAIVPTTLVRTWYPFPSPCISIVLHASRRLLDLACRWTKSCTSW